MARIEIPFDAALFGQPGITCETQEGYEVKELLYFKNERLDSPIRVLLKKFGESSVYVYQYRMNGTHSSTPGRMRLVMYREVQSNLMDVIRAKGFEGVPISMICINLQTGQIIPELCETISQSVSMETLSDKYMPETNTNPPFPGN